MPYLIGTDEAGYGPNLGPLVISLSVWWVPDEHAGDDLYELLSSVVCAAAAANADERVAIADSKQLYKPGEGVALLERGLLAALAAIGHRPVDWQQLWSLLTAEDRATLAELPWYRDFELSIPWALEREALDSACEQLTTGLDAACVRLERVRSAVVFPREFNGLCEQLGSKGAALSRLTLELLADALAPLAEPAYVVCDKHGGRSRYAALLQEHFPEYLVQVCHEGRAESAYRWGPESQRVEVHFRSGGERFLPAALASMASKYLRELAMLAENRFWAARVENLRPTAGYPVDARRFKRDIATAQAQLGIADELLWRVR
ncbi:MAG: hypothetical protein DWQ35_01745 [Planctomycetota bacterium]|nr:MAG: hypothetical protein DWQ35_01745 [Planctomycetota bacterium]REK23034.1 MAG: hypothetical protein DWQ42_16045 [Planctomycetota bacterium]REK43397.1 MAG: hypothetical protein DWQ46_11745 [Planctomycetota bacterium]